MAPNNSWQPQIKLWLCNVPAISTVCVYGRYRKAIHQITGNKWNNKTKKTTIFFIQTAGGVEYNDHVPISDLFTSPNCDSGSKYSMQSWTDAFKQPTETTDLSRPAVLQLRGSCCIHRPCTKHIPVLTLSVNSLKKTLNIWPGRSIIGSIFNMQWQLWSLFIRIGFRNLQTSWCA